MPSETIKKGKILVIDDDAANLSLFETILRDDGYTNVLQISDSREAVSQFSYHEPDLVMLDWRMPHEGGYEVLQSLRYMIPAEAFTPMIVLTADTSPETRRQALTAGATDFLCKPFDVVELTLRIETLLGLRFLYRALRDEKALLEQRVKDRTRSLQRVIAELRCSNLPLFSVNF
jgi:DNA-binding response OmpR family regulator